MSVPRRETYEGENGWADGRLGQAYDLIEAVLQDQEVGSNVRAELREVCNAVEAADVAIMRITA